MIVNNNRFQRSKYLAVAQDIAGRLYSVSNSVESYLNLREVNANLLNRIAELETTASAYRQQLELLKDSSGIGYFELDPVNSLVYTFQQARVVYNNVSGSESCMMLDKGSKDGVQVDMGVLSPGGNGIVGRVMTVSANYSLVIPVLNPKFIIDCKVKNNNYSGSLVWDGKDPRFTYLKGLPRHVDFEINDTVVTSGYSNIFQEGLPVGKVVSSEKQKDDNNNSLKVELFTNFSSLTSALIVKNSHKEERKRLLETLEIK